MSDWIGKPVDGSLSYVAEKMLVTRLQDHMFTTADGATHCIANMGLDTGLVILTSTDGGQTWEQTQSLEGSNYMSSSDYVLLGDGQTALVSYVSNDGDLIVAAQTYDPLSQTWITAGQTTAPSPHLLTYKVNPTVAAVPGGTILLSHTELKPRGMEVTFCISDDVGATWSEISFLLKDDYHASSWLISTDGLVGAIGATNTYIMWVGLNAQRGLDKTMISFEGVAGNFASHFSATTH